MRDRKTFIRCEKCGKKLIERLPNGVWRFVFGRNSHGENRPPVEMLVHGSLKMRCLRRSCRTENPNHWNILNYFPNIQMFKNNRAIRNENKIQSVSTENSGINV
jgi:hypothetical protein